MDKSEAQKILDDRLSRFTERSYAELVKLVESRHIENLEIPGASGSIYQVEVQFFWDDKQRGIVRIVGSIDDGGIRAFIPLTQTSLVSSPERMKT